MTAPALLTLAEAAATLKCSRRAIYRLIAMGDLTRAPRWGKRTCVFAESVFALLDRAYDPPAVAPARKRFRRRAEFDAAIDGLLREWRAGVS